MPPSPRHVPVYRAERSVSGAKDISTFRERDTYVIIGRGFAAVANHLTLRASKNPEVRARVDRCRFVIIGGDEPWQSRGATPLGQFPHMLGLPGYQPLASSRSYALASDFGAYIRGAEEGLNRYYDQDLRLPANAWVGLIESFDQRGTKLPEDEKTRRAEALLVGPKAEEWEGRTGYPYRLSVFWREPSDTQRRLLYLYAHFVDVCTGPGPARLLPPRTYGDGLYAEHAGEPDDPPNYTALKRITKGDQHIGAKLPAPRPGIDESKGEAEVLVYGASPSGAWSAEHVVDNGKRLKLHWCADPKRSPTTEPGASYDDRMQAYFMHPAQANAAGGRNLRILKATRHCRFLATIDRLEAAASGRIKVTFSVPEDATGNWAVTEREYDQVVISIGQDNSIIRTGSAAYLIQNLGVMTPTYAGDLWNDLQEEDQDIPVGLSDMRGHLRILGAANVAGPRLQEDEYKEFSTNYVTHAKSLPHEGRAGGNSILVATATVGLANRFTPTRLDANHACQSLIQRIVGSAEVAGQVVKARQEEGYRLQPTPDSDRYLGKGFLTKNELQSVITNEDSLSRFTQQS